MCWKIPIISRSSYTRSTSGVLPKLGPEERDPQEVSNSDKTELDSTNNFRSS
jgi:hypothetical protein